MDGFGVAVVGFCGFWWLGYLLVWFRGYLIWCFWGWGSVLSCRFWVWVGFWIWLWSIGLTGFGGLLGWGLAVGWFSWVSCCGIRLLAVAVDLGVLGWGVFRGVGAIYVPWVCVWGAFALVYLRLTFRMWI